MRTAYHTDVRFSPALWARKEIVSYRRFFTTEGTHSRERGESAEAPMNKHRKWCTTHRCARAVFSLSRNDAASIADDQQVEDVHSGEDSRVPYETHHSFAFDKRRNESKKNERESNDRALPPRWSQPFSLKSRPGKCAVHPMFLYLICILPLCVEPPPADPLAHSLLFHHTLVTDARADPAA